MDVTRLSFPDRSFDAAVAAFLFCTLPDELQVAGRHIGCEKRFQLKTILRSDAATSRSRRCASIVGLPSHSEERGGQGALMRVNIWIILAALLALWAITRYLRHQQDTQRICGDDPTASVCQR